MSSRRTAAALGAAVSLVLAGGVLRAATAESAPIPSPTGLTATTAGQQVHLAWQLPDLSHGYKPATVVVTRDGVQLAALPAGSTAYDDGGAAPGEHRSYRVVEHATRGNNEVASLPSEPADITLPNYYV